jgi:hypothetical protein
MFCRAQSDNTPLLGTWTIRSVELRQTVDNTVSFKAFNPRSAVFGFIRSPQAITFTSDSFTLVYADSQETGTYTLQGNTIHVDFPTHPCEYAWLLAGNGELQLSQSLEYVINDDRVHKAKDECKFYGRK